jgi:hypothetical protein
MTWRIKGRSEAIVRRVFPVSAVFSAFVFALAVSVSPHFHERIHADAGKSTHECAVTLIASGKYEQSDAPHVVCAPQAAIQFSNIPALNSVWVAAPFLDASILEHAPPPRA